MAITTADGWFGAARRQSNVRKTASIATIAAQQFSLLDVAGNPGAGVLAVGNTTTGIVPTDATAGFPAIPDFGGGNAGYLAAASFRNSVASGSILYDRLWHAGSVLMTALATTSFASQPAITQRLVGGVVAPDMEILIEINAAVSATATTIAVGYTNELGTTGRTTGATGTLASFTNKRVINMPLQAGDKSVQKIDSVTVGGTVATAGSFNVILARKLAEFDIRVANGLDAQSWDLLGAPIAFQDMALWSVIQPDSTASGVPAWSATIING
ncbi:MAG: hypothetical protein ACRC6I_18150 [Paracoccaceae bacterium]